MDERESKPQPIGDGNLRPWNEKLLPGYEVIAVAANPDPDNPELHCFVEYDRSQELLGDRRYVRYVRVALEWTFARCHNLMPGQQRISEKFSLSLQDIIDACSRSIRNGVTGDEKHLRIMEAVWCDYGLNQYAAISKLN